jgi:two-component system cell cycle sensor histidine kinase/response regulator CckA
MKLQKKAWVMVGLTICLLTLSSVWVSQHAILSSFTELEARQSRVESERARRLLAQQLDGLSATVMDYAYWNDTADFVKGKRADHFTENFGTDNMKYLGLSQVLVLDPVGRPVASAELTPEPALRPMSPGMSQTLRSLAVPVLSDASSKTVVRTYHRVGSDLYLVAIAAVRSQFEPASAPQGALAAVRRFDERELTQFSDILMHPVRLKFPSAQEVARPVAERDDPGVLESAALILNGDGQPVAELVLELKRDLHREGHSLAFAAAFQVAVAGLVIGVLLVVLLDRLVLRRLQRVHRELGEIAAQGLGVEGRLSVSGKDELADLAQGINRLLAKTREDAEQQRQAHARQEALNHQLMQSQKTEAMGRFTSGIAHDFNNAIVAISGCIQLACEDLESHHPSTSCLREALRSVRYADGLVKQLLSFSRQSPPHMDHLRLGALVEETSALVSLGLMKRCVLKVNLLAERDWVVADPTQMKQVIVNLVINACDAMSGQGTVSITLAEQDLPPADRGVAPEAVARLPAGRYLVLSVQDEGPGIAPEHLNRIFEPFFTTKAADKGTGLGLPIVQSVMTGHSGAVQVFSQRGAGACFRLYLPVAEAPVMSGLTGASARAATAAPATALGSR